MPPPVPLPWLSTMVAAMISRMMPLATPSAPGVKCSSLVSKPPRTSRTAATVAAVVSILRRTRRLVASGMPVVSSRNGTRAIFGPTPISSSRNVSITKLTFSDSRSFITSHPVRRRSELMLVTGCLKRALTSCGRAQALEHNDGARAAAARPVCGTGSRVEPLGATRLLT